LSVHDQLYEKMSAELEAFKEGLKTKTPDEIIDKAYEFNWKTEILVFFEDDYYTNEDDALALLAQDKPLEVLYDGWMDTDCDYLDHLRDSVSSTIEELTLPENATELRRFMNVDLQDFLGKIAEKVIVHYPNDWNIDQKTLAQAADSQDINEMRLMWHVSSWGTHINSERDTFIRDTGAYNTWVSYRPTEPDMFGYVIEVVGRNEDGKIIGNVFEVGNYADHVEHVRGMAEPLDSLTLIYKDDWGINAGKAITVTRKEYDNDRHHLMSESGNVGEIVYHPGDKVRLAALLSNERNQRMRYPIGSADEHMQMISAMLAEVRKPTEQKAQPSASKKKPSLIGRLVAADAESKAHNAQRAKSPVSINKNKKEID
jgi:hypothetical protein